METGSNDSNGTVRLKLFLMMVLQFFIWGAWLPLIFAPAPDLEIDHSVGRQIGDLAGKIFAVINFVGVDLEDRILNL